MMEKDESFGIVPLRRNANAWQVFLIQHKHGRHWGFPKGHAESGEMPEDAAARELKEETNLEITAFLIKIPLLNNIASIIKGAEFLRAFFISLRKSPEKSSCRRRKLRRESGFRSSRPARKSRMPKDAPFSLKSKRLLHKNHRILQVDSVYFL